MADYQRFILRPLLFVLWAVLPGCALFAQSDAALFPPKPEPAVYVHDYAGWLNSGDKARLEEKLRAYYQSTSTQIIVMIRPDIGDYDKVSYAVELGNRWGVGKRSKNNGVIMLIKSEAPDRGIFIATGYGTEGALPDITCGRIIRNTMAPYFKQQQYPAGIEAGLDDIIAALKGEFKNDDPQNDSSNTGSVILVMLILLAAGFLVVFLIARKMNKNNGTKQYNDPNSPRHVRRDPWGGGWWIGGGGFGGGGSSGDSGWGGGGGSDGGSFGGGSFGGGGAGGDW